MSALTYKIMLEMPFVELARIVQGAHYTMADRLKAANGLHMRAAKEMNGAGWLVLHNDEKAIVREAMAFDTTGEQRTA